MTAPRKPPRTRVVYWCPGCGREDQYRSFRVVAHYASNEHCPGQPIALTYVLRPAKESRK